jgi:molybdenum cofactor cytidylyltransferase
MKLGVIILGAGASSRMGRPKLLLPWGATSVIGHLLEQWRTLAAAQITIVCAEANLALQQGLDRLGFPKAQRIVNPQPERGMFSSIQCAARWSGWSADLTHWAVALGDQPHVQLETLRRLLDFTAAHPDRVCQPGRNGHGRHPVVLPAAVFDRLCDACCGSLKEFLLTSRVTPARCEMEDAGLDVDIDEPADYERARRLSGSRA